MQEYSCPWIQDSYVVNLNPAHSHTSLADSLWWQEGWQQIQYANRPMSKHVFLWVPLAYTRSYAHPWTNPCVQGNIVLWKPRHNHMVHNHLGAMEWSQLHLNLRLKNREQIISLQNQGAVIRRKVNGNEAGKATDIGYIPQVTRFPKYSFNRATAK